MRGAFPDLEATVEQTVAEGDQVAMRVTLSGTHRGQFMAVDPTGETFEIEHALFVRFADEEIVELRGELDAFGLLRQLGVLEEPSGGLASA
jgi:predicted ester cyclase